MNQQERILLAALLAASAGLAGCNRYKSPDKSPPRVVRVQLVDAGFTAPPFVDPPAGEYASSPSSTTLDQVPINYATIRIDLSKPVDGTFIQAAPNPTTVLPTTAGLCGKSTNVTFTFTGVRRTNYLTTAYNPNYTGTGPYTVDAQVCYNPSGLNPNITIIPGFNTCQGVEWLGSLEPAATYTVSVKGVKDSLGQALPDFTLVINSSEFKVASGGVASSYQIDPDSKKPRELTRANFDAVSPTSGIPPGWIVSGQANEIGKYVLSTYNQLFYSGTGVDKSYGTQVDLDLTSYMCATGFEALCWVNTSADVASLHIDGDTNEVAFMTLGDDGALPDRLGALRQHIVPRLPLEDGQTYVIASKTAADAGLIGNQTDAGNWADFNLGYWVNVIPDAFTGNYGKFTTTTGSAPRVVWRTASGPLAAGQGTAYLTLDDFLISTFGGEPFLGVAASEQLASGSTVDVKDEGGTSVSTVVAGAWGNDPRNRSVQAQGVGLPLVNDTLYTVTVSNMKTLAGNISIPDHSFQFRTYPFGLDPAYPGWFGVQNQRIYQSSSGSLQGNILPNTSSVGVMTRGGVTSQGQILFAMNVTGPVDYDNTKPPLNSAPARGYDIAPFKTNAESVKLYKVDEAGNRTPVPGIGGYLAFFDTTTSTWTDPWDGGDYPGSELGFRPTDYPLNGTSYVLVAEVFKLGATSGGTTHFELPFRTVPFRVDSVRGSQVFPASPTPEDSIGNFPIYENVAVGVTVRTGSRKIVMLSYEDEPDVGPNGDGRFSTRALTVRVSGPVDPSLVGCTAFPCAVGDPGFKQYTGQSTDPILLFRTDKNVTTGAATQVPVPVTLVPWRGWVRVYPNVRKDVLPSQLYTLVVTSKLIGLQKNSDGVTTRNPPQLAPITIVFRTADRTLVQQATTDADGIDQILWQYPSLETPSAANPWVDPDGAPHTSCPSVP